jgi:uncharacterized protein with GYD domain
MATYCMFGQYSSDSIKKISPKRTAQVRNLIKKLKGELISMYALLGKYDLLFIVNFPAMEDAMKASIEISKLTGISFTTQLAISVETFDSLSKK